MNFKVRVIGNKWNGKIVNQSPKNPDFGSVRFEQKRFMMTNGFLTLKTKTAFSNGNYEDLLEYSKDKGWYDGAELDGVIYTQESREPFYPNQEPKINPETGCIVLIDGKPVYRKDFYDETGTKTDDLIDGIKSVGDKIADSFKSYSCNSSSLGNY